MFVDEITMRVHAGRGGKGASSFRRESHVPFGGPDGGDGGRGGSVIFVATERVNTLQNLRYRRVVKAKNGVDGKPRNKTGASGGDIELEVPVGTLVFDTADGDVLIGDLVEDGQRVVVAKGGDGGRGNARFASSTTRAPKRFEEGWPGEERAIRLELKLLADIGLLGYPSVGKSTLVGRISNARPRVADYPFTTLVPSLGVVQWHGHREFVVADIPGIIEGAAEGKGLGHQFLRHVERTRVLAHIIEIVPQLEGVPSERAPIADFERINTELRRFDEALSDRDQIVVLNKMDLAETTEREPELRAHFEGLGYEFLAISAATGDGLDTLVDRLGHYVFGDSDPADPWD